MSERLRIILAPCLFAAGLVTTGLFATGTVWGGQAGPAVEDRPAPTSGAASRASSAEGPSTDLSVTVFERFGQFQSQLETLTGRIEQLEHELRQAREQARVRYVDMDARLNALQQNAKPGDADTGGSADVALAQPGVDDEKAAYDRATGLVRASKFDDAIKAFDAQLKDFPRGELAPLAMYWLGEMWLVASTPDEPKSARYFYRVFNEYPKSSRAGAAMYKYAVIQCQSDAPKGRVLLNKVILQHAGTLEAKQAQAALKQQCQ